MILEYRGTLISVPRSLYLRGSSVCGNGFSSLEYRVPVKYLMCHLCMHFAHSLLSGKYYNSARSIFIRIIESGCLMQIWILRGAAGKAFSICIFKNHKIRNIICYRCNFQELRFFALCVFQVHFLFHLFRAKYTMLCSSYYAKISNMIR